MTTGQARAAAKPRIKDIEEADRKRRTRDSLVLCMHHMISLGYIDSAERLAQEAGFTHDRYDLCDNMNLMQIITDFEMFQEIKYGQPPKLTRPAARAAGASRKTNTNLPPLSAQGQRPGGTRPAKGPPRAAAAAAADGGPEVKPEPGQEMKPEGKPVKKEAPVPADVRLMKPIPPQLRADFGDLTGVIARDIFVDNPGVKWGDIVGLTETKRVLREAVVMPLKFPQLFAGKKLLTPWRGVLLHGPPGTGKTMLAKAVAGEGTTFFNVSVSTIVSKWHGESEKLIRVLFELARYHAPSTIFIDELDAVMSKRSSHGEHEASRRMKTEFLVQMDGLVQTEALVFVLAASNFPFDLDPALLRRLEKRVLVPLPDDESREALFRQTLSSDVAVDTLDFKELAERTAGYSGSDIRLVCKEAAMQPLRRLMSHLQEEYGDSYLDEALAEEVKLDLISRDDVMLALERTSASDAYDTEKYEQWQNQYGVV